VPQFYVTLLNYIGLYSLVALGLLLLTGVAGQTSFGRPRSSASALRDGDPDDEVRLVAVAHAAVGLAHDRRHRADARLHHAADERPFPAAGDDRLGHQPVLPVRHAAQPRRLHRLTGIPR
jgi:hypothetical protein